MQIEDGQTKLPSESFQFLRHLVVSLLWVGPLSPAPALSLVRAFWGPLICAKCFIVCLFVFFSWSPRAGLLTIMNGARYLWYGKVGLNILDTYTAPWAFAFPFDLSFIVRCLSCGHVG